jgi:hypothetical protein
VSFDIWFSPTNAAKDSTGTLELMIWASSGGGATPAGTRQSGMATIDGAEYAVYYAPQLGPSANWSYLAYQSSSSGGGSFAHDLHKFFADAQQRGYLNGSWYLLGIQAGFEIWQGGSGFATNSYSVEVQ